MSGIATSENSVSRRRQLRRRRASSAAAQLPFVTGRSGSRLTDRTDAKNVGKCATRTTATPQTQSLPPVGVAPE
jgi:hypothetical protein